MLVFVSTPSLSVQLSQKLNFFQGAKRLPFIQSSILIFVLFFSGTTFLTLSHKTLNIFRKCLA